MIINMNGAKAPETPSPVLQEKTVTPQTLPTVIGADEGYTGLSQVTVNPDSQLIPTNIRSGKTIFGVDGSFVGEPVYTDELDTSKLHAKARNVQTFFTTAPQWNTSPVRLTELDYEKSDWVNTDVWMIAYDSGAVVDGNGIPSFSKSSVYNPSSYYFYKEYGLYEGSVKFYIPYSFTMSTMGWDSPSTSPTHIRGTLYLFMTACWSGTSSGLFGSDFRTDRDYGYGSGFYEVEIDTDLTFETLDGNKFLTFMVNVPKIEGYVSGMFYSNAVRAGTVLTALSRKMVLS